MPLYEYYCQACGRQFELLRSMGAALEAATCPEGHPGAGRTLSLFSAVSRPAGLGTAPPALG